MTHSIGSFSEETKVKLPLCDATGNSLKPKWEELGVRWTSAVDATARLSQGILPQGWTIAEGTAYLFDQKKFNVLDSQGQIRAIVCMQKSGSDPKAKVDFLLVAESSKVRRDSESENGSQSTTEGTQGSTKQSLAATICEAFKASVQFQMERKKQAGESVEDCASLFKQVDAFAAEHPSDEEDLVSLNRKLRQSTEKVRTEANIQETARLRRKLENRLRTELDLRAKDNTPGLEIIRQEMAKWD
jgi:hypothetical protein